MTTIAPPNNRRVTLEGVGWKLYQQMLAEIGDGHTRLTFDQGRLEIISPSPRHERVKTILARLIEAYADVTGINVEGLGSTTYSREDLQKGLEPDECYYISHVPAILGKDELDLTIDPPPDLAIEIDISPPDVARQPVYGALGVPEIWKYDGRQVVCLHRNEAGSYILASGSLSFPNLAVQWINELVTLGLEQGQGVAVAELRRRLK